MARNATLPAADPYGVDVRARRGVLYWFRVFLRHRLAFAGLLLVIPVTCLAFLAPYLATHDPFQIRAIDRLSAPGERGYLLGTDQLGRDVYSRLLFGARISLGVGLATVVLANVAGLIIGVLSGYHRRLDDILMRVTDALMAFPGILLALAVVAILGPATTNTVIALSVVYTPRVARVVRSNVLSIRELTYVEAARAIGVTDGVIMAKHVLPNCVGPVIVHATFIFAYAIIAEAALSFLGVGTPPEVPSWGNMLSQARQYMRQAPFLAIFPGVAIMLTVLALNLLGDALRDVLDPRIREGRGE